MSSKQILTAINNDKKLRVIVGGIILDTIVLMSIIVMTSVTFLS